MDSATAVTRAVDLLIVFGLLAVAASLGSIVARGPNPRRWPIAAVLAVVAGIFGHLTAEAWALGAAIGLTVIGVIAPAWLAARARRRALRGDFAGAARAAALLARVQPAWRGWQAVWRAADAWYAGRPAEAEALAAALSAEPSASAHARREALMGLTRDWRAARFATSVDLQSRALCELGELDAGIETAARVWPRKMRWPTIRRARGTALAPLAFAGRVDAVERLTALMRLPAPGRAVWRATALAAAGAPAEAEAILRGVLAEARPVPAIRAAAEARLAALPTPRDPGPSAVAVLDDLQAEIDAGDLLRPRGLRTSPVTVGILSLMAVGFGLQLAAGSGTEARVALELGALYAEGRLPDDPWRLLAYGFLHSGPAHLAANALAVGLLGPLVSRALGGLTALLLFVGGVLVGGLGISYFGAEGITVGASAGAMALLGGLLTITALHPTVAPTRTGRAALRLGLLLVVLQTGLDAITPMISSAGHLFGGLAGLAIGAGTARVWGQAR